MHRVSSARCAEIQTYGACDPAEAELGRWCKADRLLWRSRAGRMEVLPPGGHRKRRQEEHKETHKAQSLKLAQDPAT